MKKDPPKHAASKAHNAAHEGLQPDFQELIANAPQGILVHHNFKPLYANKAFASLLGYRSPKNILEMPILRPLFTPDMWAQVEHDYDELVNKRKSSAMLRMPLRKKNGQEAWVAGTQSGIDWCGQPAVQLSVFDISPQVAVEQTLLRTEQHLRAVLEILPYPLYIARYSDGRLLFVNRKSCLLFQRGASAMLRGTSVDFFANPEEREGLRKLFATVNDVRDLEIKMKTSVGLEFMAELSAIKMDYNGEPAVLVALNDISERKALEAELLRQASTDSLTGICNRRYFVAQAEQEMRRARRFDRPVSVMMLDLDHFKPINDRHGHAVGDAVLQGVVRRAGESLRQSDQLARFGGEEFAAILPETNLASAMEVAERLRLHLAERPIIAAGTAVPCTVSIGVAEMQTNDVSIDNLLRRADEALYRAKEQGRDRVEQAT
jgi:diguanylate cyclase (GGDEF)-like protein/PAS domain S-box-containing protein